MVKTAKNQHVYELFRFQLRSPLEKTAFTGQNRKLYGVDRRTDTTLQGVCTACNKCALIENKWRFSPKKMLIFRKKILDLYKKKGGKRSGKRSGKQPPFSKK